MSIHYLKTSQVSVAGPLSGSVHSQRAKCLSVQGLTHIPLTYQIFGLPKCFWFILDFNSPTLAHPIGPKYIPGSHIASLNRIISEGALSIAEITLQASRLACTPLFSLLQLICTPKLFPQFLFSTNYIVSLSFSFQLSQIFIRLISPTST